MQIMNESRMMQPGIGYVQNYETGSRLLEDERIGTSVERAAQSDWGSSF